MNCCCNMRARGRFPFVGHIATRYGNKADRGASQIERKVLARLLRDRLVRRIVGRRLGGPSVLGERAHHPGNEGFDVGELAAIGTRSLRQPASPERPRPLSPAWRCRRRRRRRPFGRMDKAAAGVFSRRRASVDLRSLAGRPAEKNASAACPLRPKGRDAGVSGHRHAGRQGPAPLRGSRLPQKSRVPHGRLASPTSKLHFQMVRPLAPRTTAPQDAGNIRGQVGREQSR